MTLFSANFRNMRRVNNNAINYDSYAYPAGFNIKKRGFKENYVTSREDFVVVKPTIDKQVALDRAYYLSIDDTKA